MSSTLRPGQKPRVFTRIGAARIERPWAGRRHILPRLTPQRRRAIVIISIATGLTLLLLDIAAGGAVARLARSAGASIFGPLESATTAVFAPVTSALGNSMSEDRARELEAENASLRDALAGRTGSSERQSEAARIAEVTAGRRLATGHVVGVSSAQGFVKSVSISVGSADGVEPDMAVVNEAGVVGRVAYAGLTTSTVVLITDASNTVGARVAATGELGYADGTGNGLKLTVLDGSTPLSAGSIVVTMGSPGDRPYPRGLPLGRVREVSTTGDGAREAVLTPMADMSRLDSLSVIIGGTQ